MSRRRVKALPRWTKTIWYSDLEAGDLLLDSSGGLYRVALITPARYSHNHDDVIIDDIKIVSLLNDNRCSGNARSRSPVRAFDYPWIWHSRLGCLIL